MRLRLFVALLAAALASTGCDETKTPIAPTVLISLLIAPDPVPSLTVGQTVQLVAIVSGTTNQNATWTSSNLAVATVSAALGTVRCVAVGIAVITAVSTADATARDAVTVQCIAAPAPATLIQISPTSLTFTHQVNTTSCPQTVGTVQVTNPSSGAVQVSLTGHSALSVDATSFTLAAGASRTVTVRFNCSTQQSFTGAVTFTASSGGATGTATLQVTGTINN